ncbi:dihydrofolate reductase family protein [Gulosibacter molinativorax]|uniref:Deaminase n=1 Tax=Gulosibacter molinativorax TaxID=256821 RepID=A0ABT7C9L4_9MICO|nr:dihydrofolate reductase family protein [Gulosibacter molinativorax]MDJ1371901.1 deaminase [Gulosibacter molinativorax]QUY62550.1 Bifunctional deaminase-reductase-like protein [Gulosibacter molinativorax]
MASPTSRVRVHNFTISLDGFGTGADQTLKEPFGHAGTRLMSWAFPTRTFQNMGIHADVPPSVGIDDAFARHWGENIGVEIMGRNKFAPKAGPWPNNGWQGWWGPNPPFHTPVVVLTSHPREPLHMEGGNSFYFFNGTPAEALAYARELAPGTDVRIGGGATTLREFLAADLVDEMHLVVAPIILGRGERLWDGLEKLEERFTIESATSPSGVIHMMFARRG